MRITFEASTLTASENDRLITGMLIPYGEKGKTNLGMFSVPRGSITLPSDPAQMSVNVEHERESVFGHGVRLTDSPKGVLFAAYAAQTPEGDAALKAAMPGPDGTPAKLGMFSAEIADMVIEGGEAKSGRLFGAALTKRGAFPSATLLASYAEDDEAGTAVAVTEDLEGDPPAEEVETEPTETVEKYTDEITDADGNTTLRETTITTVEDGNTTTITTETVTVEPDPEETTDPEEEDIVSTLTASARRGSTRPAARKKDDDKPTSLGLTAFASLIAEAHATGRSDTLLAALNETPFTGTTGKALAEKTTLPDWLGQLWSGAAFERRVIPLLASGTLAGLTAEGWRFTTEPEVQEWAGNRAAVPSGNVEVEKVSYPFQRFAGAWGLSREYIDFGVTEVIEAFMLKATESYKKRSDAWALAQLKAFATTAAVGTLPSGVPSVIGKIVRGALRVIDADALPNYALIAPDEYESLLFTKKDDVLGYLEIALGLESGTAENFKLVPEKRLAAGEVLVGATQAAAFDELAGSPIRVNALDIAKGGVDEAIFGYGRFRGEYAAAVQLVTNATP